MLSRAKAGLLRIDHSAAREALYDDQSPLRTSDPTLSVGDLAAAYKKQLLAVERTWRDCKCSLGLRPGLPPPRGPNPRTRPITLAGTAPYPRYRNPHRRHLAQTYATNWTACTRSPSPDRRPHRATLRAHQRPEDYPGRARPTRTPKYLDFTPLPKPPGSPASYSKTTHIDYTTFALVTPTLSDLDANFHYLRKSGL